MKDPTRIPQVIDELRRTWEGQPDLSLASLFGVLNTRGVGWGSSDEELVDALRTIRHEYPERIGSEISARYVIDTEAPRHRITIDPYRVSVRRIVNGVERPQPGVWEYERVRRCSTGDVLAIVDASGIDHRLGVVTRITLVSESPERETASLDGRTRRDIENEVYWIVLADGNGALVDHGIDVYTVERRSLSHRRLTWETLITARPQEPLRILRPGGTVEELAGVEKILPLEA